MTLLRRSAQNDVEVNMTFTKMGEIYSVQVGDNEVSSDLSATEAHEVLVKAFDDVKITPTTYVINRKGQIIKTYVGEPDFAALHALIEKSLAEKV